MEQLRIDAVQAYHIGPFKEIHLPFPEKTDPELAEIHIFTGENGSGKSTLLEILSFPGNSDKLTPKIQVLNNTFVIPKFQLDFILKKSSGGIVEDRYTAEFTNGRFQETHTSIKVINDYFSRIKNYPHAIFDYAFFAYSGYRKLDQINVGAIQEINENPLSAALDFNNSTNPQLLIQWIANTKTKEALSLAKKDQQKAAQYNNAIKRIERIINEITDLPISFELEDNPLAVTILSGNTKLPFGVLPDGLKSIISWIADLLMRMDRLPWRDNIDIFDRNFILFLDEIEVHLHPKWQRKILPVIQKLFKNAQIFVSTHSPFVIGSIDNAWVYKFEKQGPSPSPILSEDAKSYRMILEEIFDIKKQFGIEVEKQLDRFYQLKNEIIKGSQPDMNEFNEISRNLASQSNELENIIGMEIKQIKKIKGEQFEIPL